jgi:hypothetical protein
LLRRRCKLIALGVAVVLLPVAAWVGYVIKALNANQHLLAIILFPACAACLVGVELSYWIPAFREVPPSLRDEMSVYAQAVRIYRIRYWLVAAVWITAVFGLHIESPQWMLNLGMTKGGIDVILTPLILAVFAGPIPANPSKPKNARRVKELGVPG